MRQPMSQQEFEAVARVKAANKKSMKIGQQLVIPIYFPELQKSVTVLIKKEIGTDKGTYKINTFITNYAS